MLTNIANSSKLPELALRWWHDFVANNSQDYIESTTQLLASHDIQLEEFYWAYVYSGEDGIIYNLNFAKFLKKYCNDLFSYWCKNYTYQPDRRLVDFAELFKTVSSQNLNPDALHCDKNQYLYGDHSEPYDEIMIVGKPDFILQVFQALRLLEKKDCEGIIFVKKHIGLIREWYMSGITVYNLPPTFYLSRKVAFPSLTWLASVLVHEAYHSMLYHQYKLEHPDQVVPGEIYHGKEVEIKCNQHQMKVLLTVGGTSSEIEWLNSQDGSHWDQGWEETSLRLY